MRRAICLGGALACPPEDIGGVTGYNELVKALADPKHPRRDEIIYDRVRNYDPQLFDIARVNYRLGTVELKGIICSCCGRER